MESSENKIVKIKLIDNSIDTELPKYETLYSSGMDIRASIPHRLWAGTRAIIPTNLSVEIPKGYEIQIRPRSGLAAKHGITVLNSPGTIDSDYRGEIKVILYNSNKDGFFSIEKGDRIAQIVLNKVTYIKWDKTDNLTDTERNTGGFASTGIK